MRGAPRALHFTLLLTLGISAGGVPGAACGTKCEPCTRAYARPRSLRHALNETTTAEIVVAHCTHGLSWLDELVGELRAYAFHVTRITVYSKCAAEPARATSGSSSGSSTTTLSAEVDRIVRRVRLERNVGRCDHTWAHHLQQRYDELADVTFFVKDSTFDYPIAPVRKLRERTTRVLGGVLRDGFSCFRRPVKAALLGQSEWHVLSELLKFRIRTYVSASTLGPDRVARQPASIRTDNFSSPLDMRAFLRRALEGAKLAALVEQRFVRVCYGGSFAVLRSSAHWHSRATFARLEQLLSRGDSIEEGHFAERLWAALLGGRMERSLATALATAVRSDFFQVSPPPTWPASELGRTKVGQFHPGLIARCCCERLHSFFLSVKR
jgi:hypothetical protein